MEGLSFFPNRLPKREQSLVLMKCSPELISSALGQVFHCSTYPLTPASAQPSEGREATRQGLILQAEKERWREGERRFAGRSRTPWRVGSSSVGLGLQMPLKLRANGREYGCTARLASWLCSCITLTGCGVISQIHPMPLSQMDVYELYKQD